MNPARIAVIRHLLTFGANGREQALQRLERAGLDPCEARGVLEGLLRDRYLIQTKKGGLRPPKSLEEIL